MPRDPTKLQVYHLAHRLAINVYRLTYELPPSERYALSSQLRRAAASVPTNIVEGCVRQSPGDYRRFLDIATGSAAEVRYLLELCDALGLLATSKIQRCQELSNYVVRALLNLQRAVGQFREDPAGERVSRAGGRAAHSS